MKYEAKNVSGVATSQAAGTAWVNINQATAVSTAAAACTGCHLVTDEEWLTIAHNIMSVATNWSGGSVGTGNLYRGHTDNNPANLLEASSDSDPYYTTGQSTGDQRRTHTLSNGEVIWDLSGNAREWTTSTSENANSQPGVSGDVSFAWREWPALTAQGSFASSYPGYGNTAATGWNYLQGVGRAYTNNGTVTGIRGTQRGGSFSYGAANSGIFMVDLSGLATTTNAAVSFRVAK